MLKDFYLERHLPLSHREDWQEVIKHWAIKEVALDHSEQELEEWLTSINLHTNWMIE